MKVNALIWPDRLLTLNQKIVVFIAIFLCVPVVFLYRMFAQNEIAGLAVVGIYPIVVIWCFLFNKTVPIGAILVDYREQSQGTQFWRFVVFVIHLIALYYLLYYPLN
ncbi:hypothetical protein BOO29_18975 [Vibrio navarrensis]|nr:hypothetical protein [Vibrio navarrensis]